MEEINQNVAKLAKALQFAVEKHDEAKQTREDLVTPYWVHPYRVVERLKAIGINDYDVLAAAALHDVIEDTATDAYTLEKLFGKKVSQIVVDVSQGDEQSLDDYHEQIRLSSSDSQTVKLADKWDNINELRRMKYATYGSKLPLDYIRDAEKTLAACPNGNVKLQEFLRLEVKEGRKQFAN